MQKLNDSLHELISSLRDGTLDEARFAQLDRRLQRDAEARRQYVQTLELDLEIERRLQLPDVLAAAPAPPREEVLRRRAAHALIDSLAALDTHAPPPRSDPGGLLDWNRHPVRFAGVCLVLTALLWVGWWRMFSLSPEAHPTRHAAPAPARPEVVARLVRSVAPVWQNEDEAPFDGAFLRRGQRLSLASGLVEVAFERGARMVLEGPAELRLIASGAVKLESGRLTAHVPHKAAGFAVDCGSVTVIDLGTEFGVDVREAGVVDVLVFEGQVEVAPRDAPALARRTLSANESVRFTPRPSGGLLAAELSPQQRAKFVRPQSRIGPDGPMIRPVAVEASSEYYNGEKYYLRARHLIDGSRLSSESPWATHAPSHLGKGIWHSGARTAEDEAYEAQHPPPLPARRATGRCVVAEQYLIFDLGQPYDLQGALVWNHNQNRKGRGVRGLQLSISPSAEGDDFQLVEGGPWTLQHNPPGTAPVAAEHLEFTARNARRVKLAILSNHAGEPRGHVGLSEVRFLGKPTNTQNL